MSFIMLLGGVFCLYCAYKDYDWFMNSSKARLFVRLFGREGARRFYMGLGIFIIIMSLILIANTGPRIVIE